MSGNKYLIVSQGEELEIFKYVRIISSSDIVRNLHLMGFKHKVEDNDTMYYYTIGDRISLREIAETKGLRKKNFQSVISSIAYALSEAEKYGLVQSCFILDSSFIYVGEADDALLAYVPLEIAAEPKEEFRRLMGFMAGKLIDGQEEFKSIDARIKSDFSFGDLCKYFNDHKKTEDLLENHTLPDKAPKMGDDGFIWGDNDPVNDISASIKSHYYTQERNDLKFKKKGIFDRLLTIKETPRMLKIPKFSEPKFSNETGGVFSKPFPFDSFDKPDVFLDSLNDREVADEELEVTVIDDDDSLVENHNTAYLSCNAPNDELEKEKVGIENTPFIIGRRFPGGMSASELFIARKYISSPHAKIICEDHNFYIVDVGKDGNGSKGGTYVNGVKLQPKVKKPINDKDFIKFYKLEYTFHVDK